MLTCTGHIGHWTAEISHTGEQLGGCSRAFLHPSLISAAFGLEQALG
ncbi:hypothetical protein ACFY3M_54935 [Streptomyces mirabilis]